MRPYDSLNRAELATLLARAMPLLEYPELYKTLPYSDVGSNWYRSAVERTYSAAVLPSAWQNKNSFDAGRSVSADELREALNKAQEFQRGSRSGINIYLDWKTAYADLDLYILDESVPLKFDSNYRVTNLAEVRRHPGTVYWNRHHSGWGTALDFDSWAGNGNQPLHAAHSERMSVDPRKVKRPGTYRILVHYYNWGAERSPSGVDFSWFGFHSGRNINTNGQPFQEHLNLGEAKFVGQLNAG